MNHDDNPWIAQKISQILQIGNTIHQTLNDISNIIPQITHQHMSHYKVTMPLKTQALAMDQCPPPKKPSTTIAFYALIDGVFGE